MTLLAGIGIQMANSETHFAVCTWFGLEKGSDLNTESQHRTPEHPRLGNRSQSPVNQSD